MEIIRGTTPTIVMDATSDIDLTKVVSIWVYISQSDVVRVDKKITDVVIDPVAKTITVKLTQDDTLGLRAGQALFQVRLLLIDDTALATIATTISIREIYKEGVIT